MTTRSSGPARQSGPTAELWRYNLIMNIEITSAKLQDAQEISDLIHISARKLSERDYSTEQIEAALTSAWGLDTQLIADQTYFIVKSGETIIGCGGWSYRKTLFGNNQRKQRDNSALDPKCDAAKIRAFFIHPDHARKGLGKQLLVHCEQQAWDNGFTKLELGATLPGQRLYKSFGYVAGEPYEYEAAPNVKLTIVPMSKTLLNRPELSNW